MADTTDINRSHTAKTPKRIDCFRSARRILVVMIAIIIVLLLFGVGYQAIANAIDSRRYPPSGELVDIGGYRLHLHCTGDGYPTIVLDSGAAGPGLMWALVQSELAKTNRVCSYDRAGLGWSHTVPTKRVSQNMVAELHKLLTNAGIEPPYILVGHSLAGFNVRIYANQYPKDVAGIVLVNAAYEDLRLSPAYQQVFKANTDFARLMQLLTVLGITRIADKFGAFASITDEVFGNLPADVKTELTTLTLYRPQYWATFDAEVSFVDEDGAQAKASGALGTIPLVVVSGAPDVGRIPPDLGCSVQEVIEQEKTAQIALAALSSDSDLILCDTCGHYIPMTNPDLVVEAIGQLCTKVQR